MYIFSQSINIIYNHICISFIIKISLMQLLRLQVQICCVTGGQRPQGAEGANEVRKLSALEKHSCWRNLTFLFCVDIQLIG